MTSEWRPHFTFFRITLPDGTRYWGPLMRRRSACGTWEYRKMTHDEEFEEIASEAW